MRCAHSATVAGLVLVGAACRGALAGDGAAPDWAEKGYVDLEGHEGTVVKVAFAPGGALLATASRDPKAPGAIWDVRTGGLLHSLSADEAPALDALFSADGRLVALAHEQSVSLWDARTGKRAGTLKEKFLFPQALAFHPKSLRLAAGTSYGTVLVYDPASAKKVGTYDARGGGRRQTGRNAFSSFEIADVAFSENGAYVGAVVLAARPGEDRGQGQVVVWDARRGAMRGRIGAPGLAVRRFAFSPDGKHVAAAGGDLAVLFDVATSRAVRKFTGHEDMVTGVAFAPGGALLATSSADGTAAVWDVESGKRLRLFENHANAVMDVAWSPDGRLLATCGEDTTARVRLLPEELRPKEISPKEPSPKEPVEEGAPREKEGKDADGKRGG